jgi:hypothetical protein
MATILFVAYHFAPENTSGTHRSLHFARALMDAGHDVFVIAGPRPSESRSDPQLDRVFPWPERVRRVDMPTSVGDVYMRWKRRRRRSVAQSSGQASSQSGAAPEPENGSHGLIARLRRQVSIWDALPDQKRAWSSAAARAGRSLGTLVRAQLVFASGPPWSGVLAGHRIAQSLGLPFVPDFRDPWSSASGATWRQQTQWAQERVEQWEARVLSDASLVCFNSPRLASEAATRTGLGDRFRVLLNGSDAPRRGVDLPFPRGSKLAFRHFGSVYAGRSVWPLVAALDGLIASGDVDATELELELIGDTECSAEHRAQLVSTRVPVRFTPHLRFSDAVERMSEPSLLISMQSAEHSRLIPTKLFDYLCTGNPVLVMSPAESASWDLSRHFSRCIRLDGEPSQENSIALQRLIAEWRRGELVQRRTVDDTSALSKPQIGLEFCGLLEGLLDHRATNTERT